ncbi:flagellar basal body P-ring formation chaperone FlgA [Roseomonas sp. NAR14]|uniref:Flagellar basal body P-ring formation chaperone FlgA n=1 Tax=Roseomonas acroporae TaxID=2937791 RepID=A0A9X2BYD7_9PROT|nr:flagellar basal body P-ring formation chaperone FlgA [Roseomonas acroporae]MCK8786854.1 flagellar basal body P-ring formation chaperone FlgA [Roseomonas acroporae]
MRRATLPAPLAGRMPAPALPPGRRMGFPTALPRVFAVILAAALPAGAALAQPAGTPGPATAGLATLRTSVVVEDQVVRLGDLFDNAGPRATTTIGQAPAPGRRMVLEAAQILAIARANGITWRPLALDERVVIERPGRPVARDEILDLLRAELGHLGLDQDAELDLAGFSPPLVPLGAFLQLAIENAAYEGTTHRFAATLAVMAEGLPTLRVRLAGRALATAPVVLANRRLPIGAVVGPGDVRLGRLRVERVRGGLAQRPEEVVGQQLRRPLAPDLPIATADLGAPIVVPRNTLVTMQVESGGLSLSAQGRALGDGTRGGMVPVMNLASRMVVEARVVAPGQVRVAMGTMPAAPDPLRR